MNHLSTKARSSKLEARSSFAVAAVVAAAAFFCGEARAQNMPFSTHDWTLNFFANPFVETWADVKTPGGTQRLDRMLILDPWPGNRPYRLPLFSMPTSGTSTVSVQLYCLLDPTPGTGPFGFTPVTFGPGCAAEWAASPALWFSF